MKLAERMHCAPWEVDTAPAWMVQDYLRDMQAEQRANAQVDRHTRK